MNAHGLFAEQKFYQIIRVLDPDQQYVAEFPQVTENVTRSLHFNAQCLKEYVLMFLPYLRMEAVLTLESDLTSFQKAFECIPKIFFKEEDFASITTLLTRLAQRDASVKPVLLDRYQRYKDHAAREHKNGITMIVRVLRNSLRAEAIGLPDLIKKTFQALPLQEMLIHIVQDARAEVFPKGSSVGVYDRNDVYGYVLNLAEYLEAGIDLCIIKERSNKVRFLQKALDHAQQDIEAACIMHLASEPHEQAYRRLMALRKQGLAHFATLYVKLKEVYAEICAETPAQSTTKNNLEQTIKSYAAVRKRLELFLKVGTASKARALIWELCKEHFSELLTEEVLYRRTEEVVDFFLNPKHQERMKMIVKLADEVMKIANFLAADTKLWRSYTNLAFDVYAVFVIAKEVQGIVLLDQYIQLLVQNKKTPKEIAALAKSSRCGLVKAEEDFAAAVKARKDKRTGHAPPLEFVRASDNDEKTPQREQVTDLAQVANLIPPNETIDALKDKPVQGKLTEWVDAIGFEFKCEFSPAYLLKGFLAEHVHFLKMGLTRIKKKADILEIDGTLNNLKMRMQLIAQGGDKFHIALADFSIAFMDSWAAYQKANFEFTQKGQKNSPALEERFIKSAVLMLQGLQHFKIFFTPAGADFLKQLDSRKSIYYLLKQSILFLCSLYKLFSKELNQKPGKSKKRKGKQAQPFYEQTVLVLIGMVNFLHDLIVPVREEHDLQFSPAETTEIQEVLGLERRGILRLYDIFEHCQALLQKVEQQLEAIHMQDVVNPEVLAELPAESKEEIVEGASDALRQIRLAAEQADQEFMRGTQAILDASDRAAARQLLLLPNLFIKYSQCLLEYKNDSALPVVPVAPSAAEEKASPARTPLEELADLFNQASQKFAERDFAAARDLYDKALQLANQHQHLYWSAKASIGVAECYKTELCHAAKAIHFKIKGVDRINEAQVAQIQAKFAAAKAACLQAHALLQKLQNVPTPFLTKEELAVIWDCYHLVAVHLYEECAKFTVRIKALRRENEQTRTAIKNIMGIHLLLQREFLADAQTHGIIEANAEADQWPALLWEIKRAGRAVVKEHIENPTLRILTVLKEGILALGKQGKLKINNSQELDKKIMRMAEDAWCHNRHRQQGLPPDTKFGHDLEKWCTDFASFLATMSEIYKDIKAAPAPPAPAKKPAVVKHAAVATGSAAVPAAAPTQVLRNMQGVGPDLFGRAAWAPKMPLSASPATRLMQMGVGKFGFS